MNYCALSLCSAVLKHCTETMESYVMIDGDWVRVLWVRSYFDRRDRTGCRDHRGPLAGMSTMPAVCSQSFRPTWRRAIVRHCRRWALMLRPHHRMCPCRYRWTEHFALWVMSGLVFRTFGVEPICVAPPRPWRWLWSRWMGGKNQIVWVWVWCVMNYWMASAYPRQFDSVVIGSCRDDFEYNLIEIEYDDIRGCAGRWVRIEHHAVIGTGAFAIGNVLYIAIVFGIRLRM